MKVPQYVTRTYALGEVPQIMKDHFTLVAISNLQLGSANSWKVLPV